MNFGVGRVGVARVYYDQSRGDSQEALHILRFEALRCAAEATAAQRQLNEANRRAEMMKQRNARLQAKLVTLVSICVCMCVYVYRIYGMYSICYTHKYILHIQYILRLSYALHKQHIFHVLHRFHTHIPLTPPSPLVESDAALAAYNQLPPVLA